MPKFRQLPENENDVMRRQRELVQALQRGNVVLRLADLARVPHLFQGVAAYQYRDLNLSRNGETIARPVSW